MANGNADHGIPVVDLSSPTASQEMLAAGMKHGFIFLKQEGSGLAQTTIDSMFKLSKTFFAAPASIKDEGHLQGNLGWIQMQAETLDPLKQKRGDFKEGFNIGEFRNGNPQQTLPGPLGASKEEIAAFMKACHDICQRILTLLADALAIPDSEGGKAWFTERHDPSRGPSTTTLRLLYYPTIDARNDLDSEEDVRAGAHSDYGSITLLFRLPGQPGLEIQTPSGGWAPVPVNPDPSSESNHLPILLNIGDAMSFWTGGLLKSTVHRVVFPGPGQGVKGGEERYSIAYFCHPLEDASLASIPSPMFENQAPASGKSIRPGDGIFTAKDYLDNRVAATYYVR